MFPGAISEGIVNQGNAKVFGWKGASVETKDSRDVALDLRGRIEKEDLGLFLVAVQS